MVDPGALPFAGGGAQRPVLYVRGDGGRGGLACWGVGRRRALDASVSAGVWLCAVLVVALSSLAGLPAATADCWTPGVIYRNLCDKAANNIHPELNGTAAGDTLVASYRRRLLWHGGGPAAWDEPDHDLGDNKRYRGDGGTLHDSDIGGENIGEPGTVDSSMQLSSVLEDSFFLFVEQRAVEGNTEVFGREDSWYKDLFECDPLDPSKQLCERCGDHCNSWDWETSGYSVLNETEFEIENLFWMSKNVYITETTLLPLSVCVQYDWWVCYRRLDENIRASVQQVFQ